jgi:hypothetical protein
MNTQIFLKVGVFHVKCSERLHGTINFVLAIKILENAGTVL